MSRTVTIDGQSYTLPTGSDANWLAGYNRLLLALIEQAEAAAEPRPAYFFFGANGLPCDGATRYLVPGYGDGDAPTTPRDLLAPANGTLSAFRVSTVGSEVAADIYVRINGVNSALLVTLDASVDGADLSHEVAVSAGDRISVAAVTAPISSGTSRTVAVVTFTPTEAD